MDWKPIDYGRFEATGILGTYIIFPKKINPDINRYGADEEWVVSFCQAQHGHWKEIETSTNLDNAKWMADNYDSYRASKA